MAILIQIFRVVYNSTLVQQMEEKIVANTILSWLVSGGLTVLTVLVVVQLEGDDVKIVTIIFISILTSLSFWTGKTFGFLDGRNKAAE